MQNKLHFAAHGHTAAEIIYERADADKPFMGLTSFSGELPALKDINIAKNYLQENELRVLNNLVSGYFDLAEVNAIEHRPMYMKDYIRQLDSVLSSGDRQLLQDSGTVSHTQAVEKAKTEYRKYQNKTIAPVEEAYLGSIKTLEKEVKKIREIVIPLQPSFTCIMMGCFVYNSTGYLRCCAPFIGAFSFP